MKELLIAPTQHKFSCCNNCYAQNYEPTNLPKGERWSYQPALFDLHIGNMAMCLCPDCMRALSTALVLELKYVATPTKEERTE